MRLIERIRDPRQAPAVVAELSGNHRQRYAEAAGLVRAAAEAGAHAVKLQTYTPESLTLDCGGESFVVKEGLWKGQTLSQLYAKACTPYEWHRPLAALAKGLGIELFSSPFDEAAVDFLEESLDPPLYKIASFELTHIPLLRRVGAAGKPVLLSVGMAKEAEIAEALQALEQGRCPETILLKCVSAYPSRPEDARLRALPALAARFRCLVGLSDHTLGDAVPVAAAALGARVIEKHLVASRESDAVDAAFSLEPEELARLVRATRDAHAALGEAASIGPVASERACLEHRRSIYVARDVARGERLTAENLRVARPAFGLHPRNWDAALGKRAARPLKAGSPLAPGDWEEPPAPA